MVADDLLQRKFEYHVMKCQFMSTFFFTQSRDTSFVFSVD